MDFHDCYAILWFGCALSALAHSDDTKLLDLRCATHRAQSAVNAVAAGSPCNAQKYIFICADQARGGLWEQGGGGMREQGGGGRWGQDEGRLREEGGEGIRRRNVGARSGRNMGARRGRKNVGGR